MTTIVLFTMKMNLLYYYLNIKLFSVKSKILQETFYEKKLSPFRVIKTCEVDFTFNFINSTKSNTVDLIFISRVQLTSFTTFLLNFILSRLTFYFITKAKNEENLMKFPLTISHYKLQSFF